MFGQVRDVEHAQFHLAFEPVHGGAVWLPPGEAEMTPERIAAAGMDQAPAVLGTKLWERFMGVMEYDGVCGETRNGRNR